MSIRTLRRRFRAPSSLHAPWIGWAWNHASNADELADQAEAIAAAGLGGTAIYPFHGLDPDHHGSPAWCEHIAAVARRVRRKRTAIHLRESFEGPFSRLQSELCDNHEELCLTELYAHLYQPGEFPTNDRLDPEAFGEPERPIIAFLGKPGLPIRPDAHFRVQMSRVDHAVDGNELQDGAVLVFGTRAMPNRLNYLDRRAAELYLQVLPEQLYQHARRYFGNPITGLFLDGIGLRLSPGSLPWDPELPSLFQETRGYSLVDALPGLFLNTPDFEAVRFDYWNIISDMLREGLATPLRDWCTEHRIRCGLSLRPLESSEPDLLSTALLPVDRNNDDFVIRIPYGDAIAGMRGDPEFADWFLAIKRAVSITRQSDGARRTAISIGSESEELSLDTLSGLGIWLLALGADTVVFERLLVEHNVSTSETGVYLHAQQPNFGAFSAVGETHARLQDLFSRANESIRAAVVFPAATVQTAYRHPLQAQEEVVVSRADSASFASLALKHAARLCWELSLAGIPFDVIEERTLASLGTGESGELHAGAARYNMLVLPPSSALTRRTVDILHDFAVGGGRIVLAGTAPLLANGVESKELAQLVAEYAETYSGRSDFFDYAPLVSWLTKQGYAADALVDNLESPGDAQVRVLHTEECIACVVTNNTNRPQQFSVEWRPGIDGHIEEWNPLSGEMRSSGACAASEPVTLSTSYEPSQCRIFVAMGTAYREPQSTADRTREPVESGETVVQRVEPNMLQMQRCAIFETSDPDFLWDLSAASEELDRQIGEAGHDVSWTTTWTFEVSDLLPPKGPYRLMIPAAGMVQDQFPELRINNDKVFPLELTNDAGTTWYSHELSNLPAGKCTVEVQAQYESAENFRAPRIVGDFWVQTDGSDPIVESCDSGLRLGPWSRSGMPHYRGAVAYETTLNFDKFVRGRKIEVDIPRCSSPILLEVNGTESKWIYRTPTTVDITGSLKRSDNHVRLLVVPNPAIERGDTRIEVGLMAAPTFHATRATEAETPDTTSADGAEE